MNDPYRTEARTGIGTESRLHCDENSSAEELEKCTEATRRNVSRTMQRVEDRLAPSRLYDDAWQYLQQVWADARNRSLNLDQVIANNPVPFAVMGIGLVLVGGSVASYAFKKMSDDDRSHGRIREHRFEEAEPADIPAYPYEAETVIPPGPAGSAFETELEHEATTEEVQKDILATAEKHPQDDFTEHRQEPARFGDQDEFATRKPRHS